MHCHTSINPLAVLLAVAVGLSSCGAMSSKNDSLNAVDDLLNRVERVQVESLLSKERSHAAFAALQNVVAPDFAGDPVQAYTHLMDTIAASKNQAQRLSGTVGPLKQVAGTVFQEWAANLESFGGTKMRQASQARLEETRARFDAIIASAGAAQLAYDGFNADLNDNALFLEHDFNASAVAVIVGEVQSLASQELDLHGRLDNTVAASKAYIESSALRGQLAVPGNEVKPQAVAEQAPAAPTPTPTPRRRIRPATPPAVPAQSEGMPNATPQPAAPAPVVPVNQPWTGPTPTPVAPSTAPALPPKGSR